MKSLLFFQSAAEVVSAGNPEGITQSASANFYTNILIVVLIITALLALIASVIMLKTVQLVSKRMGITVDSRQTYLTGHASEETAGIKTLPAAQKPSFWSKFFELKPVADEKEMFDHQFDGISELNNPTPAWFMWLFYITIAFAFVYLLYYHGLDYGPSQEEEYVIEMKLAETERIAYLAKSGDNIDENSVKETSDGSVLSGGLAVFMANCSVCHGDKGQGIVGPNLTDEYWLHGGSISNIFKTIKYGVPEKGMISWEKTLNPKQISDVSNYILSLDGTNPPGGKAPQGDKKATISSPVSN
jgi:cytochrome c oxidase cbb3-type subunit 3